MSDYKRRAERTDLCHELLLKNQCTLGAMHLDAELADVEGGVGTLLTTSQYFSEWISSGRTFASVSIYRVSARDRPTAYELTVVGFGRGNAMLTLAKVIRVVRRGQESVNAVKQEQADKLIYLRESERPTGHGRSIAGFLCRLV